MKVFFSEIAWYRSMPCLALLLLVVPITAAGQSPETKSPETKSPGITTSNSLNTDIHLVVDPDSVISLEAPYNWTHVDLGLPEAAVQMANENQDGFLMLIIESKDDFFGWNMTRFLYVTIGQSVAALNLPEVSEHEHGEVDGSPSARVIVSGATSGQQYTYLKVAIDAPQHWIQVILGSKRSFYQDNLPAFEAMVASIDLLDMKNE